MFGFKLSRRLYFAFANERMRVIILSHSNPLAHYSFLQTDLSVVDSRVSDLVLQTQSVALRSFMEKLNERRHIIRQIQRDNYRHMDLSAIELRERTYFKSMNEHAEDVRKLKAAFASLCEQVPEVVNGDNVLLWLEICCKLEIIECKVWSRLLSVVISRFEEMQQKQQTAVIGFVHSYVKGRFISFTFSPSKFLYRENYLVDLTNFRRLIRLFLAAITRPNPDMAEVLLNLQQVNNIIEKVSKSYVINFNEISQDYGHRQAEFQRFVEGGSLELIVEYLKFLSIIGHYDLNAFASLQKAIKSKWREERGKTLNNLYQNRLITQVLTFWANANHFDAEMFNEFIRPHIMVQVQLGVKEREFPIWLFQLASCDADPAFLEQLLPKIGKDHPMSNKYLHIVTHYLHSLNKTKGYCSFLCTQHPATLAIVKKHGEAYLNCMTMNAAFERKEKGLSYMSREGMEENPPEEFWLKATKRAFLELKREYPDPSNAIYFNFNMCVFQIDALVMLGGVSIAVQLGGSHYHLHDLSSPSSPQKQGKKLIKERILSSYGVRFLELTSTSPIERNINSFRDQVGATRFLRDKMRCLLA